MLLGCTMSVVWPLSCLGIIMVWLYHQQIVMSTKSPEVSKVLNLACCISSSFNCIYPSLLL